MLSQAMKNVLISWIVKKIIMKIINELPGCWLENHGGWLLRGSMSMVHVYGNYPWWKHTIVKSHPGLKRL